MELNMLNSIPSPATCPWTTVRGGLMAKTGAVPGNVALTVRMGGLCVGSKITKIGVDITNWAWLYTSAFIRLLPRRVEASLQAAKLKVGVLLVGSPCPIPGPLTGVKTTSVMSTWKLRMLQE